jgi:NodT family efflux transporter outer membrane factor (OMF) lipoprotein
MRDATPATASGCARRAAALALAAALAGCTVGPDFHEPAPTHSPTYVPGQQPALLVGGGEVQQFVEADGIRADWWALFGSPRLDALIAEALAKSPTLDQARARLVEAGEAREAGEHAATWPSADLRAGIERQRIDPAALGFPQAPNPGPFNLYDVGIDLSYTFDVFGGARRTVEGLQADVDYQRYEFEAAQRALAANVVTAALHQASVMAEIATVRRIAAAQRRTLAIAQERFALGAIATVDLAGQRAQVAQTEARLPPLEAELARSAHALAIYTGREPAQASAAPFTLADFTLPPQVPLTLPSTLAARRPDIRANAALLHRASADIGVATAELYPKFTLSGNASSTRESFPDIGNGINIWSIALNLLQPVLRGPELEARKRAAIAAFDAAKAGYRASVLHGLQEVADALRALEADARELEVRARQRDAAREASDITRKRFELGGVSELAVLDSERTRLEAEIACDEAVAARLADTAALLDALGGAWWTGPAPPAANAPAPATASPARR